MNLHNVFSTPAEFKFAEGDEPGVFSGYGAVVGNTDSHGDVIAPGAFAASIAEHKAAGTMPALFVEHSAFKGGDPLPIGAWTEMDEDSNGLRVKGKISALDTDIGRRVLGLMKDKALRGLSIAFSVPPGGAVIGKAAGEPKRLLKQLQIVAVDVVRSPSNSRALIDSVKSIMVQADHATATAAVADAMRLHQASMTGGNSPNAEQRAAMLDKLKTAHLALTGEAMPAGCKVAPETAEEMKAALVALGFTNERASAMAREQFKQAPSPSAGDAFAHALAGLDFSDFTLSVQR